MIIETRICKVCCVEKKIIDFPRNKGSKDGYELTCKKCCYLRQMAWKKANKEKSREYQKNWARNRRSLRRRALSEANRSWLSKNAGAAGAHCKVHRALKRGELVKPPNCEKCGEPREVEAHHPNYSNPLQVIWLCDPCHAALRGG